MAAAVCDQFVNPDDNSICPFPIRQAQYHEQRTIRLAV